MGEGFGWTWQGTNPIFNNRPSGENRTGGKQWKERASWTAGFGRLEFLHLPFTGELKLVGWQESEKARGQEGRGANVKAALRSRSQPPRADCSTSRNYYSPDYCLQEEEVRQLNSWLRGSLPTEFWLFQPQGHWSLGVRWVLQRLVQQGWRGGRPTAQETSYARKSPEGLGAASPGRASIRRIHREGRTRRGTVGAALPKPGPLWPESHSIHES